ncbi:hypothetical protein [Vibrio sp. LaRot3]|uniref:hypothetical protein n=1 Tax=Vibrio sp. LaRot3 TaxID=2998829 RepID=UPI0022CDE0ED|nr:hypothetical protein [Vibrio sp. LaRot3]MDA0150042.1 hypothetical protein [Vibrio sp. LaRot3]
MDTVKNQIKSAPAVMNKFGTLTYALIAIGSFLPAVTIKVWGSTSSVTGADFYGLFVVLVMLAGAVSCAMGLPKIISKGIGALSLAYLYYNLYQAYRELAQFADMMGSFGGSSSRDFVGIPPEVFNVIDIGFPVLLIGFVFLNILMFKGYKLHPRFEALDVVLQDYSNKASQVAKEKTEQAKQVSAEKAAQIQEKANEIKQERAEKQRAEESKENEK